MGQLRRDFSSRVPFHLRHSRQLGAVHLPSQWKLHVMPITKSLDVTDVFSLTRRAQCRFGCPKNCAHGYRRSRRTILKPGPQEMPAEREAGRDGLCHTNNGSDGGDDTGDSSDTGGDTSDDATGGGTDTGMAPPDGTVDGAGDEGAKRPTDSIWWWTRMAGYGGVHSDPEDDREGQSAKQKYQDKIIAFLKKQVFNPGRRKLGWRALNRGSARAH
jgi:hypothetical protein